MSAKPWEVWEADVVRWLDLSATTASGSQPHDPGDATTYAHPDDQSFRILADAKYTEHASFSVGVKFWAKFSERAAERGKRFLLPVRLWPRGYRAPLDLVVLSMDDFRELYLAHQALTSLTAADGRKP